MCLQKWDTISGEVAGPRGWNCLLLPDLAQRLPDSSTAACFRRGRREKMLSLDEGQKVGVQDIGIDGQHAVRQAGIGLQCAVFQKLDRLQGSIRDRNDLVVFAVQHQRRNGDRLQVFGLISFREWP